MTVLLIAVTALFFYICCLLIFAQAKVVVGTIYIKTIKHKEKLKKTGYEVIHADDFRNQNFDYKKSGVMALKKFILHFLLFKEVALFTSNPKFLKFDFINVIPLPLKILDLRTTRSENIDWVRYYDFNEILIHLPAYFSKSENINGSEFEQAEKRLYVFIEELENYPDDRFLPEQILEGNMGGILQHN